MHVANIVRSVMGVSTRTKPANKVKSVMGVSTQASSPMEVGTEKKSVM